ncbi:GIY-YIG nuclease family protein, partial [Aeromonas caviae]
ESLSAYFPEMVFTDSGITVQLHRNTHKFDVHTLAFVEDAPKVERALHELFSENRVNKDNFRKEFFFTDPKIVKEAMEKMGVESDWYFEAEAKEFRESELIRTTLNAKKSSMTLSSILPASI